MPKFKVYLSAKAEVITEMEIEAETKKAAEDVAWKTINSSDVNELNWEIYGLDPFEVDIDYAKEAK